MEETSMSGNEERIFDIPICPECGEMPAFWIMNFSTSTNDGSLWFFSEEYIKMSLNYSKLHVGIRPRRSLLNLDNIRQVRCRRDNGLPHVSQHYFHPGHPVFEAVIESARRYWDSLGGLGIR